MLQDEEKAKQLFRMYKEWKSFQITVDMVEMVLAKSEPANAHHYENMLIHDDLARGLEEEIRQSYEKTEENVLELGGNTIPVEKSEILLRNLRVRNPYVDARNIMRAEALKRVREREGEEESKALRDALRTTIAGISNGLGCYKS